MSKSVFPSVSPAWLAALLALGLGIGPALGQDDPPPEDDEGGEEVEEGGGKPMPRPMLPGPDGPLRRGLPGPGRKPIGQTGVLPAPEGDGAPPAPPPPAGDGSGGGDGESRSGAGNGAGDGNGTGQGEVDEGPGAPRPGDERQRPPVLDPNAKVTIDFVDTDINDIIKYMAEITGRNFILGEKLSGTITIISHQKVTVAEAYEAFLSALEVTGYTTVTVGKATKVVKTGEASKTPLRIFHGEGVPYTDNFVTQIVQLENVDVKDISSVVKELASNEARIISYSPTNTLIMTDAATNLRRVYGIIKELDVASPRSTVEIIALTYATAADVETIIEELYGVEGTSTSSGEDSGRSAAARRRAERAARRRGGVGGEEPAETTATTVGEGTFISKIIADERTNSLIVQANEEAMTAIKELVAKLDVDVDPSSRSQIHVVYLEHASAEDVAQVLSNLANASSGSSSQSRTGARGGRGAATDARGRPMPPGRDVEGAEGAEKSTGAVAAFESGLRVASDENTNSLVIIAGPEEFQIIKQVIDKLDIRRKQVFVEVVILEMASEDTFDMGIGYHTGTMRDDGGYGVYSAQLNGSSLGLTQDALSGLAMGVFGKSMTLSVDDGTGTGSVDLAVPVFGVAINALQGNSRVNIISTPNVLTTDNEEAEFVVGRNIPFPVSTGRDSNNNPIVSYQREDVATTLKVTPQINESNYVTLEVYQEVQEVEEDSQGLDVSTAGFITSKRSAETTVVVRDNQTVVLGGLIGNTDTEVESKIPLLGDLPLIGALFRGRRTVSRKTNLLIFLTPHVIDGPEDLEEVYRVKVAQREEFVRRFYGKSREEQDAELAKLLQYSMNLVDRPSAYRTKLDSTARISTIGGEATVGDPAPPEALPEEPPAPEALPEAAPPDEGP